MCNGYVWMCDEFLVVFVIDYMMLYFSGSPVKGISAASVDSEGTNKNVREATPVVHSLAKLVISGGEGYIDFRTGQFCFIYFTTHQNQSPLSTAITLSHIHFSKHTSFLLILILSSIGLMAH